MAHNSQQLPESGDEFNFASNQSVAVRVAERADDLHNCVVSL